LEDGPPQVGVASPWSTLTDFGAVKTRSKPGTRCRLFRAMPAAGSPTFEHGRQLGRFAGSDQAEAMGAAAEPLPAEDDGRSGPSSVAARSRSAK